MSLPATPKSPSTALRVAPVRTRREHARDNIKPSSPVFEHLRWQPFLAWRGNRPVGRISAQLDTLVQVHRGENNGYFGMFESEDDSPSIE